MLAEIAPFVMVVLIVLIVTIGKNRRARYQALGDVGLPAVQDLEAERLKREVTRLNERIAVLERLATDPAKRLSAEIDALDDTKR